MEIAKDNQNAKQIIKHLSLPISQTETSKLLSKKDSGLSTNSTSCLSSRFVYTEEPEKLDWSEGTALTNQHMQLLQVCTKYERSDAKVHWDYLAANYEGMYLKMGYPDPKKVAKMVYKCTKKYEQNPADISVLDLGCGTGLIGKYLGKQGFKNVVGLDISPNMLEEASNKGVYSELHEHTLGEDPNTLPDKFKNKFDYVVASGLINNNHMDYLIFEEMMLACKKGGYIVFATRYSYMGMLWYDKIIKEIHNNGRWKLKATDAFFKYDQLESSIGRFSKTPCKVFVFEKLQDDIDTFVNRYDFKVKNFLLDKFTAKPEQKVDEENKVEAEK